MSVVDPLGVAGGPDVVSVVEKGQSFGDEQLYAFAGRLRVTRAFVRGVLGSTSGRIGVTLLGIVLAIVIVGPLVRPDNPSAVVTTPFASSSGSALLGGDILGRDTLSRFLSGGGELLGVALGATLAAYAVGLVLGLSSGYRRGVVGAVTIGTVDVFLAIPPIILSLVIVAALGSGIGIIVFAVAFVQIPIATRLVRSFTLSISTSEYVDAAVARGERAWSIVFREILPNIRVPILADFGVRLSWSIVLIASLCFLGFGPAPPAANWGLMVSENRDGILTQPMPVLVPAIAIAVLVLGVNLTADAFGRAVGRSSRGGVRL